MTTKSEKQEKALAKLKKLQALYESSKEINSEGEANAAAAAIQRLLTSYNLSMEDVEEGEEKDSVMEEIISGYNYHSIEGRWEFNLMHVICHWNFCKCRQYGKSYKRLIIFGKKENLETSKYLKKLLSDKFVSFSVKRWKEYRKTKEFANRPISKDSYQRSYLIGCADGLYAKLKEESEAEKSKDKEFETKVTSLILRTNTEISDYIKSKYRIGKATGSRKVINSSYAYGFKDGKNSQLHKEVSTSSKSQVNKVGLLR